MTLTPNDYAEALEHIAGVMAYHLYHHDAALLRTLATAMREGRPHLDPVAPGDFVLTLPPKEAP